MSEETSNIALVFYYTTTLISQTRSVCVRGNTQHSSGILLHYNFDQSNKVSLCQRKHPIAQVFYYTTTLISQTRSVCVRGNTQHSSGILSTTTLISQTRSVCVRGNTQHSSGILLHYNFDQSNKVSLCQRKHPT